MAAWPQMEQVWVHMISHSAAGSKARKAGSRAGSEGRKTLHWYQSSYAAAEAASSGLSAEFIALSRHARSPASRYSAR